MRWFAQVLLEPIGHSMACPKESTELEEILRSKVLAILKGQGRASDELIENR